MRTKALLGLIALGASSLAALAQSNVYSLNVVGYVNIACTNRLTLIANPLNCSPNNAISNVLANVAPGSGIYYFQNGNFGGLATDPFAPTADWGTGANYDLSPGKGFYFDNGGTPQTLTFVGEVAQGTNTVGLGSGYTLVASPVPQAGYLADLGLVASPGDYVYLFHGSSFLNIATDPFSPTPAWSSSDTSNYDPAKGPFIGVGEGFYYNNQSGAAATWKRVFTVQ